MPDASTTTARIRELDAAAATAPADAPQHQTPLSASGSVVVVSPFSSSPSSLAPTAKRVARLKSYWIEDDALSLNRRQYPREAVDQLIASAQRALSDPDALPLTCYISHAAADADDTLALCGRITEVGREGRKGYAWIDIPDTEAGRTMATLAAGGYIRSQSLRADGAEIKTSRDRSYPQVGGASLTLRGIDFTTTPGLDRVARIGAVLFESHNGHDNDRQHEQHIQEVFTVHPHMLTLEQQEEFMGITEDAIPPLTSGTTVGMDGAQTRDGYAARMQPIPSVTMADTLPSGVSEALNEAHDRSAAMLNMECASAAAREKYAAATTEAGKAISGKNAGHLAAIHDKAASALGKACEGQGGAAAASTASVPLNMDSMERHTTTSTPATHTSTAKESRPMTPEEMLKSLQERGYKVEAPKTQAQLLQEQLAEQNARIEKLMQLVEKQATATPPAVASVSAEDRPVRRSLVEGARISAQPSAATSQRRKSFVKERLDRMTEREFAELADPSKPLPDGMNAERLLKEFEMYALARYDERYGLVGD